MNLRGFRNRPMHTRELKTAMGCQPGPKGGLDWPAAGLPPRLLDNVLVWVGPAHRGNPRNRKSSTHRAMAKCPQCGATVPAGRLHQHLPACARAKL